MKSVLKKPRVPGRRALIAYLCLFQPEPEGGKVEGGHQAAVFSQNLEFDALAVQHLGLRRCFADMVRGRPMCGANEFVPAFVRSIRLRVAGPKADLGRHRWIWPNGCAANVVVAEPGRVLFEPENAHRVDPTSRELLDLTIERVSTQPASLWR